MSLKKSTLLQQWYRGGIVVNVKRSLIQFCSGVEFFFVGLTSTRVTSASKHGTWGFSKEKKGHKCIFTSNVVMA